MVNKKNGQSVPNERIAYKLFDTKNGENATHSCFIPHHPRDDLCKRQETFLNPRRNFIKPQCSFIKLRCSFIKLHRGFKNSAAYAQVWMTVSRSFPNFCREIKKAKKHDYFFANSSSDLPSYRHIASLYSSGIGIGSFDNKSYITSTVRHSHFTSPVFFDTARCNNVKLLLPN